MSLRNTRRQNRGTRRRRAGPVHFDSTQVDLPGPLRILSNRRLFVVVSVVFGVAIVLSLLVGAIGGSSRTTPDGPPQQANEAPDVPQGEQGTPGPSDASPTPAAAVKRYSQAPAVAIDPAKRYVATVKTPKGDIQIELYASEAPEAVNAFVFLARDGYYNGTPFMELVKNTDGSPFYAQAGDPTRTGFGTPGFSIKKETTTRPFVRGAVGMGGSAENSNGGQFFISYADMPALSGKYTIFGQVVAGLDVLERLALLDLTTGRGVGAGDEIQSITISEL
ncbi:MAG TPA: peptidylprolyl isomerase [Dehalococcoidia bacterium]